MHFYNLIVNYYCSVISISNSKTLVKTQVNGTYLFIHDFAPSVNRKSKLLHTCAQRVFCNGASPKATKTVSPTMQMVGFRSGRAGNGSD